VRLETDYIVKSETVRSFKQNLATQSLGNSVLLTLLDNLHRSSHGLQKTVVLLGLGGYEHTVGIERRKGATLDSTCLQEGTGLADLQGLQHKVDGSPYTYCI
jgi:hypothetical protein